MTPGTYQRIGGSLSDYGFFLWIGAAAVMAFVSFGVRKQEGGSAKGWSSLWRSVEPDGHTSMFRPKGGHPPENRGPEDVTSIPAALAKLQSKDSDFSFTLFEDFVYTLYAEAQVARGAKTLERLEAYIGETAQNTYRSSSSLAEVRDVVIGAMRIERILIRRAPALAIEVKVHFEVNYTEVDVDGKAQSYWATERWILARAPDVASRPPEKARILGCPSCGAPLDKSVNAKCGYCGVTSSPGAFDWTVIDIAVLSREPRGPMLTGTTEEVGTDLLTRVAPDVQAKWKQLATRDPAISWKALLARVDVIFRAFHDAWSSQDLSKARPYLSDNLFQFQRYWVDAYQREGLRNLTEGARIVTVHLARIVTDKHYDAITLRVYASCKDYTLSGAGEVVGGSRTKERQYSEYWTLIRGAERRGEPRVDPGCPSCGAPTQAINMAGRCGHCGAHITAGEFDWVLSRIEQDEAYAG
jgi:hypothetical protein